MTKSALESNLPSILVRMKEGRIFSIERSGNVFLVAERCDACFEEHLTGNELRRLGLEIIALADGC